MIDVAFAFPVLFLALMVVTVFGANVASTLVAVALGTTAGYARMIRGQLIAVRDAGYVEAGGSPATRSAKIVWRHILPNALRPLLALFTLGIGNSIIWASGLSFLGLGVPPPAPEWGALLDAGRDYTTIAWWLEVGQAGGDRAAGGLGDRPRPSRAGAARGQDPRHAQIVTLPSNKEKDTGGSRPSNAIRPELRRPAIGQNHSSGWSHSTSPSATIP